MSNRTRTFLEFFISPYGVLFLLLCAVIIIPLVFSDNAISRSYRQTKPDDMVTRNAIDDEFDRRIQVFEDLQIQADTLKLTVGNTVETVYVDDKYVDLSYKPFVSIRKVAATHAEFTNVTPLTDSSFVLTKEGNDTSVVQWMTIYK